MQYHPKTSASKTQLYLDGDGNAALEVNDRLFVLLAGSFTRTRLQFKETRGPVWANRHASVRLTSQGSLDLVAGANHLTLHPVPQGSVLGVIQHQGKAMALASAVDAFALANRGIPVDWQGAKALPDGVTVVAGHPRES